jgi:hypothetical protein
MSEPAPGATSDADNALYVGAVAAAVVALFPYVNVFIIPAYVVGALVAVRYATRARGRSLVFKEAAKLGFLSPFLGTLCAVLLADLVWLFFDYQLWNKQNSDLIMAIAGSFAGPVTLDEMRNQFAQNAEKPFQWYMFLLQLVGNAILSGIFGTLSGLLGVKIFRPRSQ